MRQVWISQTETLPRTSMQLSRLTVLCLVCLRTTVGGCTGFCALFGKVGTQVRVRRVIPALCYKVLWFKMNGSETGKHTSFSTLLLLLLLLLSLLLWISVCLAAQCDLPGHRTLQDVPSHGHLETRLRLPGQHQVRALRSPRYSLMRHRKRSAFCYLWSQVQWNRVWRNKSELPSPPASYRLMNPWLTRPRLKSSVLDGNLYSRWCSWAIYFISPPPLIFWNLIRST